MSTDAYIGSIVLFAGDFAPKSWAFCNGALLAIQSNAALFSILGTTYGGNGTTTFQLPDLRGRVAEGTGSSAPILGQVGGSPTVTLLQTQLPIHTHAVAASQSSDTTDPSASFYGNDGRGTPSNIYATTTDNSVMNSQTLGLVGGGLPVNITQPYTGLNYIICVAGLFPPRD